jgi:hypothetical protein
MEGDTEGKRCGIPACGKPARFYSSLLETVYCSDECYDAAREQSSLFGLTVADEKPTQQYIGHGQYAPSTPRPMFDIPMEEDL